MIWGCRSAMATPNPGRFNPRISLRRKRFRSRHTKPRRRRRSRIQDCTHMPRIVRSRCEGARGKCCSRTRPTPPRPNRNSAKARHHCIPPPSASPQVSVRTSPASTATRTKLPHVFRTDLDAARPLFCVCAGHRPATQGSEDRQERAAFDTPTGYQKRPPTGVSAGQGPFQHVVAGEGFEPSKLSRWIYSPLPLAARATCLGADGRIATGPRGSSNRGGPHQDKPHHIPRLVEGPSSRGTPQHGKPHRHPSHY